MQQTSDDRSLGELFGELSRQMTTLVRQEVELARTETTAKVTGAAKNVALLAAGGAVIFLGAMALVDATISLLASLGIPVWVSALIVGAALVIVGYFLVQRGLQALRQQDLAPRRTIETIKEDAEVVRGRTK